MYDLIIVGAGPAGIFTALELLRKSCNPHKILLIEKGKPVEKRHCPKDKTGVCVNCKPTCAITTGFSGAGAFSDGKLSLSYQVGGELPDLIGEDFAQELIDYTDKIYLEFGADPKVEGIYEGPDIKDIRKRAIQAGLQLVDCPIRHLGTEKAQQLYLNIQNYLADAGVEMLFNTECENIILEESVCKGVRIREKARHDAAHTHLLRRGDRDGHVADRAEAALHELDGVERDEPCAAFLHAPRERAGQMAEDDGVELRKRAGVAENYIAQLLPVQSAVGGEDIAERVGQVGAQRRVSPEHFVVHRVAVEHQRAALFQRAQQRGLTRAGAAGDAENKGAVRLLRVEAGGLFQPVADGEAKPRAVGTLRPDGGHVRRVEGAQRVKNVLRLRELIAARAEPVNDVPRKERRELVEAENGFRSWFL